MVRNQLAYSDFLASSPAARLQRLENERDAVAALEKLGLRLAVAQRKLAGAQLALGEGVHSRAGQDALCGCRGAGVQGFVAQLFCLELNYRCTFCFVGRPQEWNRMEAAAENGLSTSSKGGQACASIPTRSPAHGSIQVKANKGTALWPWSSWEDLGVSLGLGGRSPLRDQHQQKDQHRRRQHMD